MSYSCCTSAIFSNTPCDPNHGVLIVLFRSGVFTVVKRCAAGTTPPNLLAAYQAKFPGNTPAEGQCYALCCDAASS